MAEDRERSNFWATLPGILTGLATLITALIALIAALVNQGVIHKTETDVTTHSIFHLQVDAASEEGTIYTYPITEKPAKLHYEATGKWRLIPAGTRQNVPTGEDVGPEGITDQGFSFNSTKICGDKYTLGALVVIDLDSSFTYKCIAVGANDSFEAKPGGRYKFVMNDTYYPDNKGGPMDVNIYRDKDI